MLTFFSALSKVYDFRTNLSKDTGDYFIGCDQMFIECVTVNKNVVYYSQRPLSALIYNTWRPRQNGRHFADDIFFNVNVWIVLRISLKFVPKVRINNIPALIQIMPWCRPDAKPFSEPMMLKLLTHTVKFNKQRGPFIHDNVMIWKHFVHYWPFRGWIFLTEGQWCDPFMFFMRSWRNCWPNSGITGNMRLHDVYLTLL